MKKVLVIEDDQIVRENITELLEFSGYTAEAASEGKEGIQKALDFKPDLIVCDIKMPKLDGYGVLHILRKNPATQATPVIFLTAKTDRNDRRKGMEMGAHDYITKPFESTELLTAIETRLKRKETFLPSQTEAESGTESFFKEVSEKIPMKQLIENLEPIKTGTNKVIFREGDNPHYLFQIKQGSVKTSRVNPEGKEFISNIYFQGDFFGYQPIIEDRTYNESAVTLEACEVYRVPKKAFLDLISSNKQVAARLIKTMSAILTEKEKEIVHLAYDSVRKRLAYKLLEMIPEGTKESFDISRTNLASLLGTTPETIVRTLTELKEDNILDTDGQSIVLLDREKLKMLLERW
jgi:DNA-binding response OmpR family regulator